MKNSSTRTMTAKRIAVAVAAVCATMSAPSFAAGTDVKALMDLLLKKGVITQQEYDQNIQAAVENEAFKEKRIASDVNKLNNIAIKNADTGSVMKNGIGIQSSDGANTLQLTGRVHFDARQYSQGAYQDRMEVRRARLGIRGQIAKDFKYEIVGDFGVAASSSAVGTDSGMSNQLTGTDVAYVDYVGFKPAQVRIGRFKMPFSLEQLTSSNNIDTIERSLMGQFEGEFVPAKETGAMLYGNPMSGFTWAAATSRQRGNSDATTSTGDYIGRVTANVAELTGNKDYIAHLGFAASTGEVKSATPITSARTEAREEDKFFTMNTSGALSGVTTRKRMGSELAFAYKGFKVQGEMFDINYDSATGQSKDVKGYYTQAVWNVTGENHNYSNSAGTFGGIKPISPFTANGGTGAVQLVVRYSELDGSGAGAVANGKTSGANAMTYGLNWVLNENARVMLNLIQTKFDSAVTNTGQLITKQDAIVLRGQLAF
jgi:phosphate-selective porin OprO and OprP